MANTNLTTNLIDYWKLEDLTDSVGANSLTGTSITFSAGKIRNGAYFNGGNYYLGTTENLGIKNDNNYTISGWFRCHSQPALGEFQSIFYIRKNGYHSIDVDYRNESGVYKIVMGVGTDSKYTQTLTTDAWYYFVLYRSSTTFYLYMNGASFGSRAQGSADNADWFTIGNFAGTGSRPWKGTIDEVGLWTRALSATEIKELWANGGGNQYPFASGKMVNFM